MKYFFDILENTLEETQRLYSDTVTALKGNFTFRKKKLSCNRLYKEKS